MYDKNTGANFLRSKHNTHEILLAVILRTLRSGGI